MVEYCLGKRLPLTDSINVLVKYRKEFQSEFYRDDIYGILTKLDKDTLVTLKDTINAYNYNKLCNIVNILTTIDFSLLCYITKFLVAAMANNNLILILIVLVVYQVITTLIFTRESNNVHATVPNDIPTVIMLNEIKTHSRDFVYAHHLSNE